MNVALDIVSSMGHEETHSRCLPVAYHTHNAKPERLEGCFGHGASLYNRHIVDRI